MLGDIILALGTKGRKKQLPTPISSLPSEIREQPRQGGEGKAKV